MIPSMYPSISRERGIVKPSESAVQKFRLSKLKL
jgi:hypothetical protein